MVLALSLREGEKLKLDRRQFVGVAGVCLSSAGLIPPAIAQINTPNTLLVFDQAISSARSLVERFRQNDPQVISFDRDPSALWYTNLSKICDAHNGLLVLAAKPSIAFQLSQLSIQRGFRPMHDFDSPALPNYELSVLAKTNRVSKQPIGWS